MCLRPLSKYNPRIRLDESVIFEVFTKIREVTLSLHRLQNRWPKPALNTRKKQLSTRHFEDCDLSSKTLRNVLLLPYYYYFYYYYCYYYYYNHHRSISIWLITCSA